MQRLKYKDILSTKQFSVEDIENIFGIAGEMEEIIQ
jgi:hypothetical protein